MFAMLVLTLTIFLISPINCSPVIKVGAGPPPMDTYTHIKSYENSTEVSLKMGVNSTIYENSTEVSLKIEVNSTILGFDFASFFASYYNGSKDGDDDTPMEKIFADDMQKYRSFLAGAQKLVEEKLAKISEILKLPDSELRGTISRLLPSDDEFLSVPQKKHMRQVLCRVLLEEAQEHSRKELKLVSDTFSDILAGGITEEQLKNMISTVQFVQRYQGSPPHLNGSNPSEDEPSFIAFWKLRPKSRLVVVKEKP